MSICCNAYLIHDQRVGDEICENCGRAERYYEDTFLKKEDIVISGSIEVELKKICDNNNFQNIIFEKALSVLRMKKGKKTIEQAALSLHTACQFLNVPRTLKEISSMFFIRTNSLSKKDEGLISLTRPSQLAVRVLSSLNITSLSLVEKISSRADKLFFNVLVSVSPQTALAVSIIMEQPELGLNTVAKHCHISVQTLKKHMKKVSI